MLGERFRGYFSDFVRNASRRGSDHRQRSCGPPERKSQGVLALTAAISGLMPIIFSTRVIL
jgi:hypothetical protein